MHRPTLLLFVVMSCLGCSALAQDPFALPKSEEGLPGEGKLRRYDGYVKTWARLRRQWSQQVEQDQNAVVFLGDSITQGWGPKFRGQFAGVKLANRGIGGDTTRGMLIRLKEDVLSLNPKAVVILMGTNDLEVGLEPALIARNFQKIIVSLKSHSKEMPIIVCRVFPSSASKKRPQEKIEQVNALYAAAVRGDAQITLLDTWSLYQKEGNADPAFFPDLLHLNNDGYAKWASALRPIFATLGYLETEPDSFEVEAGFVSLFNGRDLTGWGFRPTPPRRKRRGKPRPDAPVFVQIAKAEAFDGKPRSSDGRYAAINGRLVVTTPAEGRRIQQLWTTREFDKDFTLKLEFRATPNADSGVFIRKPQLQCRDYLVAGPFKSLKKYKPQDWNELIVTVKDGVARATCNGELLTDNMKVPATGPIGLEGDRGQMEYRRIRIRLDE